MVQPMMSTAAAQADEPTTTVQATTTKITVEPGQAEVSTTGVAEATTTAEVAAQPDNPILPTGPELIWGAVTFTLLWALMKFVLLKPIQKTMEDRADKVRADLATAESAKVGATGAMSEYEGTLANARVEAGRIIEDARAEAETKRKEILAEAEAEVAGLRSVAAAEVTAAKTDALAQMRGSVATIAVQAAEAVVQKRLDENAQRSIVDDYLNRVGSQN